MKTFLFQGDSITDACRGREDMWNLGYGYPDIFAAKVSFRHPGEFRFVNRGVSGDKAANMYARLAEDTLDEEPDYLSILIGVNDQWHPLNSKKSGYSIRRYEQLLTMFVEDVREAYPDVVIVILEPFVLDGTGTHSYFEAFDAGVRARAQAAKAVAEKFGLIFVPLQEKLTALAAETESANWLIDGVHPTQAGHELIAQEMIKALNL